MKKSLIQTDKDRYPSSTLAEGEKKERKTAPTITLTGAQVEAFCGDGKCNVGDTGSATFHYVVKSASSGNEYGDELPSEKADRKLTLAITHVESDEEGDDEEDEETPAEENETMDEGEHETPAPDRVSPAEAMGEDDHDPA